LKEDKDSLEDMEGTDLEELDYLPAPNMEDSEILTLADTMVTWAD